jgi:hypothetical protein
MYRKALALFLVFVMALSPVQILAQYDGEYEEVIFDEGGDFEFGGQTLFPIDRTVDYRDLSNIAPLTLNDIPLTAFFSQAVIDSADKIMWTKTHWRDTDSAAGWYDGIWGWYDNMWGNLGGAPFDNFRDAEDNPIDLLLDYFGQSTWLIVEFIVGSGNQLDPDNHRYLFEVSLPPLPIQDMAVRSPQGTSLSSITWNEPWISSTRNWSSGYFYFSLDSNEFFQGTNNLILNLNSHWTTAPYTANVYIGESIDRFINNTLTPADCVAEQIRSLNGMPMPDDNVSGLVVIRRDGTPVAVEQFEAYTVDGRILTVRNTVTGINVSLNNTALVPAWQPSTPGTTQNGWAQIYFPHEARPAQATTYKVGFTLNNHGETLRIFTGSHWSLESAINNGEDITSLVEASDWDVQSNANGWISSRQLTAILTDTASGDVISLQRFDFNIYFLSPPQRSIRYWDTNDGIYDKDGNLVGNLDWRSQEQETIGWVTNWHAEISPHIKKDDELFIRASIYCSADDITLNSAAALAMRGHHASGTQPNQQRPNIAAQLFPDTAPTPQNPGGLAATLGELTGADGVPLTVSVVQPDGNTAFWQFLRVTASQDIPSLYFEIEGLNGGAIDYYAVPFGTDSYVNEVFNYHTLLVDDMTADLSDVNVSFFAAPSGADVYAVQVGGSSATRLTSGSNRINFSNGRIVQFDVVAGGKTQTHLVNIVQKRTPATLFVNGPVGNQNSPRIVIMTDSIRGFEMHHDIFFANIGNSALTGITVDASNARGVILDPYWKAGGAGNNSLRAFTTVFRDSDAYGELFNVGKIRLLPDPAGNGEISGYITIGSANGGSQRVYIQGFAGSPILNGGQIQNGVRFVPYQTLLQVGNVLGKFYETHFRITDGFLPDGVSLNPNTGEIYGVPLEHGVFDVLVATSFKLVGDGIRLNFPEIETMEEWYWFDVEYNNAAAVAAASSPNHGVLVRGGMLPLYPEEIHIIPANGFTFNSEGIPAEFAAVFINGNRLLPSEYTVGPGSTRVTLHATTVQSNSTIGSNTIAMEFRQGGTLSRTAQNYNLRSTTIAAGTTGSRPLSNNQSNQGLAGGFFWGVLANTQTGSQTDGQTGGQAPGGAPNVVAGPVISNGPASFNTTTLISVDGVNIQAVAFPQVARGIVSSMINPRVFAHFIGAEIIWDDASRTAAFTGKNADGEDVTVVLNLESPIVLINGEAHDIAVRANQPQLEGMVTPVVIANRMYVPARILAETFGIPISFENGTVTLG